MAKTATVTKTKAATKAAVTKTARPKKADAADKPKREPTAYQVFCKEHMKKWNEDNPGRAKEAMTQIALMWKDAPENPNRGQDSKARKPREPKAPKAPKEPKAKAAPKKKAPPKKKADTEEEDPSEAADDDDGSD